MSENNQSQNINEEKYKKFFYNSENLENIYNILKGEEKQLKKETIKKLIQDFEGVEYDDIKEDAKNNSNNISDNKASSKMFSNSKDKDSSGLNNISSISNNNSNNQNNIVAENDNSEYISFEEFCNIFKNIYESSQNPNKIFLEGFCYMDKDK